MNKHQHDRAGREQVQRREYRNGWHEPRASDNNLDNPRRSRHAPYRRASYRYLDEWDFE